MASKLPTVRFYIAVLRRSRAISADLSCRWRYPNLVGPRLLPEKSVDAPASVDPDCDCRVFKDGI
jgi:hypothetical protein